jgi:tryptophan-rich sensory protein
MGDRRRALVFGAGGSAAAAALGSVGSRGAPDVYGRSRKPSWAPPAAVFGPVWTVLYTAIGVAGTRLWRREARPAVLGLHIGQLALNAAWPFTFFAARNRRAAIAVTAALDAAIGAEIVAVVRRDPVAAALLAPYLAWTL